MPWLAVCRWAGPAPVGASITIITVSARVAASAVTPIPDRAPESRRD